MRNLILYCALVTFFLSCKDEYIIKSEDIIGSWALSYRNKNEAYYSLLEKYYDGDRIKAQCCVIYFNADGTFYQELGSKVEGKWQIESSGENKYLVLIYPHNKRTETNVSRFSWNKSKTNLLVTLNMKTYDSYGNMTSEEMPIYR